MLGHPGTIDYSAGLAPEVEAHGDTPLAEQRKGTANQIVTTTATETATGTTTATGTATVTATATATTTETGNVAVAGEYIIPLIGVRKGMCTATEEKTMAETTRAAASRHQLVTGSGSQTPGRSQRTQTFVSADRQRPPSHTR